MRSLPLITAFAILSVVFVPSFNAQQDECVPKDEVWFREEKPDGSGWELEGDPQKPGFKFHGPVRRMPFMMGPMEIRMKTGNRSFEADLSTTNWTNGYDMVNRTMIYDHVLAHDEGPMKLHLEFRPIIEGQLRTIRYNLTISDNIPYQNISINWQFLPDPEKMEDRMRWKLERGGNSLDKMDGTPLMYIAMDRKAKAFNGTRFNDLDMSVNSSSDNLSAVMQIDMVVDPGIQALSVGGEITLFEDLFSFLNEGKKRTGELIRDHIISVSIGISLVILAMTASLIFLKSKGASTNEELDYHKSRYFKKR